MKTLSRAVLVLVITALIGAGHAAAQQAGASQASIDDLKAPPSPAFVLLGVAPTKVERPQAVRPLVLSALTAAGGDGLPRNYAVEFAPYWLGTPEISFDQYYKPGLRAIPQHLSVSVATTPLAAAAGPGSALALGARTLPLPGRAHPQLVALRRKLVATQRALNRAIGVSARRPRLIALLRSAAGASGDAITSELETKSFDDLVDRMRDLELELTTLEIQLGGVNGALQEARDLPESERKVKEEELKKQQADIESKIKAANAQQQGLAAETMKAVDSSKLGEQLAREAQLQAVAARLEQAQTAQEERLRSELRRTALQIQALDTQRVGPLLAVAGAAAWTVPEDDSSNASMSRWGLWLTPGYRMVTCATGENDEPCTASVDALGVVRYIDDRSTVEAEPFWELGARVVWQPVEALAVSGEWLGRAGSDADAGTRLVGVAEYRITESVYLYASFGRDFAEPGTRRNLVSTIGLTFGFGNKPIIQ